MDTHTVADLKFTGNFLVTASCDRTAASWDWATGERIQTFTGHAGAVFSVDFNISLDILVTVSSDSTVRVWSLTTGEMLRTLTQHRSRWLQVVHLYHVPQDDHYFLLSRDSISIHFWKMTQSHEAEITENWYVSENPDEMLIPNLLVQGSKVKYSYKDASKNGELYVVTRDFDDYNFKQVKKYHSSEKAPAECYQHLLGSGAVFDVFLVSGSYEQPRLDVFHNTTGDVVFSIAVDKSFA